MVNLSDIQQYERKFENQLAKLDAADIDDRDRDAIRQFIRAEDAESAVNTGTLVSHLNRLRLASERSDVPLVEMNLQAVDELLSRLKREHGLSPGTRRNYRKALRKFFAARDEDWAEDIAIGAAPDRKVDPSKLLTMDDIEALLREAKNPRDKALVAVLADAGLRISAIASLRVRDFQQDGPTASVRPNQDGPVKGASDPVPLTWSAGYVANWLDVHPRRDDPDVALFHAMEHFEPDDDGALTYQYLGRRIRRLADAAGIDRDRVNTHNFRKSAISRWIREDMSEQVIKHRAHWVKDSSQFELYSGVTAEEMNEQIRSHYGLASADEVRPDLENCPYCRTPVPSSARYCPGCSSALTAGAAAAKEAADDEMSDEMVESERAAKRAALRELMGAVDDDPTLLDGVELPAHDEPSRSR